MKKIFMTALLLMTTIFAGCGGSTQDKTSAPEKNSSTEKSSVEKTADTNSSGKKILVLYFSRTGEEYNVGNITKGNTAIVADLIAQKLNADKFEIKAAKPYPDSYEACTDIAKKELESNARPAFEKNIDNLAQYDTVFIGFPIWWGAVPRVLLTFLEANDLGGKTIIPFCTHGGSGLAGTEREIAEACPNSTVRDGLAIVGKQAQVAPEAVDKQVDAWLKNLGY
ncbi:MAG: NAD(P)H-dependent oxidoreductase [Selenomonadaceae bacterium]|nr:NAD(P)H-dependent oxidoreductase [Selenomonadaceae bacterium]